MFGFGKKQEPQVEKPKRVRNEAAYPTLKGEDGKRYDDLSREMDFVALERGGPKYAVQIVLRLVVELEARVNKLEEQTFNQGNKLL